MEDRIKELERKAIHLSRVISGDGTAVNLGVVGVLENHTAMLTSHDSSITDIKRTIDRFRWSLLGWAAGGALGGGILIGLLGKALGWPT